MFHVLWTYPQILTFLSSQVDVYFGIIVVVVVKASKLTWVKELLCKRKPFLYLLFTKDVFSIEKQALSE